MLPCLRYSDHYENRFNITKHLFANSRAYKHWQRTLGQLVDHNNRTPSGFNNHEMSIRALTALSQTYFLKHSSDVLAMASAGSALSNFTICMRGDRSIALEVGRVTLGSRNERLLRLKISGRVYGGFTESFPPLRIRSRFSLLNLILKPRSQDLKLLRWLELVRQYNATGGVSR